MGGESPIRSKRSEFLYVWFGWLPPPRYLSLFFFFMLVFGLSVLLFGFVKECEIDCSRYAPPPVEITPHPVPTHSVAQDFTAE